MCRQIFRLMAGFVLENIALDLTGVFEGNLITYKKFWY